MRTARAGVCSSRWVRAGSALAGPTALLSILVCRLVLAERSLTAVCCRLQKADEPEPTVLQRSAPHDHTLAEGWGHLMDRERCLAVAVEGFGRGAVEDSLAFSSDGVRSLTSLCVLPLRFG